MRSRLPGAGLLTLVTLVLALTPAAAHAARLIGGREQAAITRAFLAGRSHQGEAIVSIRSSTVAPAWTVVTSVTPVRSGRRTSAGHIPRLLRTYYHLIGGHVRLGMPPAGTRTDLDRDFRVAVVYAGSGSETIAYHQLYRSVCPGAGGFADDESVTITPMSWRVRYTVDLDVLRSAVRSSGETVLVPAVSFDRSRSTVSAHEILTRTVVDEGCDGQPTTFACDTTYGVGSPGDGLLSFPSAGGVEIGVPTTSHPRGDCNPSDYTLGRSLWDGGATTAVASSLGLVGARLPAHPYAPVRVSWPGDSLDLAAGYPASPCQGDGAACHDTFHWTADVTLQATS